MADSDALIARQLGEMLRNLQAFDAKLRSCLPLLQSLEANEKYLGRDGLKSAKEIDSRLKDLAPVLGQVPSLLKTVSSRPPRQVALGKMAPSFGGQAKQVEVLAARIAANLKGFRQKFSDIQERAMACTENTSVQTYTQDERSIKTRVDKYMDIILPVAALAVMCLQCLGKKIEVK